MMPAEANSGGILARRRLHVDLVEVDGLAGGGARTPKEQYPSHSSPLLRRPPRPVPFCGEGPCVEEAGVGELSPGHTSPFLGAPWAKAEDSVWILGAGTLQSLPPAGGRAGSGELLGQEG